MMSQYCSEGASLREEISSLSVAVQSMRSTAAPAHQYSMHQAPPSRLQVDSDGPQGGIDPELKKRLNNAIAKLDWPTFSGEGE